MSFHLLQIPIDGNPIKYMDKKLVPGIIGMMKVAKGPTSDKQKIPRMGSKFLAAYKQLNQYAVPDVVAKLESIRKKRSKNRSGKSSSESRMEI